MRSWAEHMRSGGDNKFFTPTRLTETDYCPLACCDTLSDHKESPC